MKRNISVLVAALALFIGYTNFEMKETTEYTEITDKYKRPIEYWPSPEVDKSVTWKEFEALEVDTLYYETQDLPEVVLGKALFFDPKLSKSNQISCSSCHDPELGWTDHRQVSLGNDHLLGARNTPSLYNIAERSSFFWDGRALTLEEQAKGPLSAHHEMDTDVKSLPNKIKAIKGYKPLFREAYGDDKVTYERIVSAIATFQKTIKSQPSRFDKFVQGEYQYLTEQEVYGMHLFRTKAGCMNCHNGKYFTDEAFHNIGLTYYKREYEDLGLYLHTNKAEDVGKFKTPSLRDLLVTKPWMHNGLMDDLEGIVNLYNSGMHMIDPTEEEKKEDPLFPSTDPLMKPLKLNEKEIKAIVAFLESLSGSYYKMERPIFPTK
ncbi:cytochrome-c peroxidase [Myroides marinus]|uniref:cytochrome-c peroxidase n=1 Tax=Myroides marinus TaxID=703342 RepID=UPI0025760F77|nr:cytochrome c peroxidase [Myroides marinus]MDM1532471.1 cytochrome-c peroxidase [Myroides marinus]MDM1539433.1 cytochrome-c peroxidase [Myroides marinus]